MSVLDKSPLLGLFSLQLKYLYVCALSTNMVAIHNLNDIFLKKLASGRCVLPSLFEETIMTGISCSR